MFLCNIKCPLKIVFCSHLPIELWTGGMLSRVAHKRNLKFVWSQDFFGVLQVILVQFLSSEFIQSPWLRAIHISCQHELMYVYAIPKITISSKLRCLTPFPYPLTWKAKLLQLFINFKNFTSFIIIFHFSHIPFQVFPFKVKLKTKN